VQALTAARDTLYQQARRNEDLMDPPTFGQLQADALHCWPRRRFTTG